MKDVSMKDVSMINVIADELAKHARNDRAGESFANIPKVILKCWADILHEIVEKNKTVNKKQKAAVDG